jgi:hypothetical protein
VRGGGFEIRQQLGHRRRRLGWSLNITTNVSEVKLYLEPRDRPTPSHR